MIRETQVIIAREVDHFSAVVVANRRLLIIQSAQREMGCLRLQFIQYASQIRKLRACSRVCHRFHLNPKSIARNTAGALRTGRRQNEGRKP